MKRLFNIFGHSIAWGAGTLLLLVGCASEQPHVVLAPESPDPVDFSGSWELDYELSEDPNDKLRYLYEITRSQYMQQEAVRRDIAKSGRTSSSGVYAAGINALQGVIGLGKLAEKITRSTVLTIDQSLEDVVVGRQGDFALTCEFLGERHTENALGHESCGWQGDQLIFNVALPEGLNVNHRLVLSDNGRRLNIATTVSSSEIRQLFTLNRVFMPYKPGKGAYECEYTLAKKKTCNLGTAE